MKLTITQNIFAPNEELFTKNIKSIQSLYKLRGNNFRFIGWAKEDYWNSIEKAIKPLNPEILIRQEYNYGKAFNMNVVHKNIKTDFLLTLDSDIILNDSDYMRKIEEIIDIPNIGIIAFNQLEHNCHITQIQNMSMIHNNHRIIYNNNGNGIAGGCILVNKKAWEDVNGYRVMGVYAGEDGYFFKNVKEKNYFVGLDTDIYVTHPQDNDREYQLWKLHMCHRDSNGIDRDISEMVKNETNRW